MVEGSGGAQSWGCGGGWHKGHNARGRGWEEAVWGEVGKRLWEEVGKRLWEEVGKRLGTGKRSGRGRDRITP